MIRVVRLTGSALVEALPLVARLRINVFREWPYLYDGTAEYELEYLQVYRDSPDAILVAAYDGDELIGASTGTPMEDHSDSFSMALSRLKLPTGQIFYCAESVLLPDYRGRGLGHAFFDAREAHAADLGRTHVAFCGVIRPDDHPLRPADYTPLDAFWQKRGYRPVKGAVAHFEWKDIDQSGASAHALQFWMRKL